MTRRLFGTDGIRGIANQHPMTCEVALALGRAVAYQAKNGTHRHRVIIGKDTRVSCYMLEMALASGICSMGVDAVLVGPLPTPAIAFLTRNMRADAGIMISASHNPYYDNGIKIFARDGFKLPDPMEAELEHLMEDERVGRIRPTRRSVGKAFRIDDALGRYIVYLKDTFPHEQDLARLKVVVDCAHGAAYKVAPIMLRELGATVHALGIEPNGSNINKGSGALHPRALQQAVRRLRADVGLALDGDADRLVVVDEQGSVVDGDCLLALHARALLKEDKLKERTLVTTVMSNLALDRTLESWGVKVVRTQVGDRYVVEAMRQSGFSLGGEQSGHVVFMDHGTTGDGLLAALQLLSVMVASDTPLSQLTRVFEPYPQALVNVAVRERRPIAELVLLQERVRAIESALGDHGRVMIRYSGTEPKARILVEGPDAVRIEQWAAELASEIDRAVGA